MAHFFIFALRPGVRGSWSIPEGLCGGPPIAASLVTFIVGTSIYILYCIQTFNLSIVKRNKYTYSETRSPLFRAGSPQFEYGGSTLAREQLSQEVCCEEVRLGGIMLGHKLREGRCPCTECRAFRLHSDLIYVAPSLFAHLFSFFIGSNLMDKHVQGL